MVPRVDLLYVCSRFLWRMCFPLAWTAGRWAERAGVRHAPTGIGANAPTPHQKAASTNDVRERIYIGANAITLIAPFLALVGIGRVGDVLAEIAAETREPVATWRGTDHQGAAASAPISAAGTS